MTALPLVNVASSIKESGGRITDARDDLGTWSGRGSSQTGSFDVTSGALRVTWEARESGAPGAGRLRVDLHSAISGRPLQTVVDVRGAGADTAYVADEPRVSYLQIDAHGVDTSAPRK